MNQEIQPCEGSVAKYLVSKNKVSKKLTGKKASGSENRTSAPKRGTIAHSAETLKRAKQYATSGKILAAARTLMPLRKAGAINPEIGALVRSLASRIYARAISSYQRRRLPEAAELVRVLLLLTGPSMKRALDLQNEIRLAMGKQPAKKAVAREAVTKKTTAKKIPAKKAPKKSVRKKAVTRRSPEIQVPATKPTKQVVALSKILNRAGKDAAQIIIGSALPGDPEPPNKGSAGTLGRLKLPKLDLGALQIETHRLHLRTEGAEPTAPTAPRKGAKRKRQQSVTTPTTVQLGAERDSVVRRTPHMEFSTGEPLTPGTVFDVSIFADQQQARAGEESSDIVLNAPQDMSSFNLDVQLLTSSHFVLDEGTPSRRGRPQATSFAPQQIEIRRESPDSSRAQFSLRVLDADKLPDTQPTITALFRYQGRPSGQVTRHPAIAGLVVAAPNRRSSSSQMTGTFVDNTPPTVPPVPPSLRVQHDAIAADLTISIVELAQMDGCHFHLIADAPAFSEPWEGDWTLRRKTEDIVSGAMKVFTSAENSSASPIARIAALRGAGIEMFKATPAGFQEFFWRIMDSGKPLRSILIVSQEPYLPWEIMVPQRRRKGLPLETRAALGAEFAIGRWVTSQYDSPPQKIAISQTYIVAPQYPPERKLAKAEEEVQTVKDCFSPAEIITPALVVNIAGKLAPCDTTLLHFVCHGKSGFPQSIALEQDKEELSCWQLAALDDFTSSFSKARTFVFLNACEVGRTIPSLVGVGGFGNAFVDIGASGVIAPLWSVEDNIAHQVAENFYASVKKDPSTPFADILRGIRQNAYTGAAEDTWAAYCFYGDPLAHCV
jgi:hypothetical protein